MNGEFEVSQSNLAEEKLRELLEVFRLRGKAAPAARAVRWIIEELSRTPMQFGESRDYLEELNLHVRVGFARPWRVNYAVHLPSQSVFIQMGGATES